MVPECTVSAEPAGIAIIDAPYWWDSKTIITTYGDYKESKLNDTLKQYDWMLHSKKQ
jgi:hypothetical protein